MAPPNLSNEELRQLEIDNGFRQFDYARDVIVHFLDPERPFALRASLVQELQKIAVEGVEDGPGDWRKKQVKISKSEHQPPDAHLVPSLIVEMCDYVNDNWHEKTAFFLSSFIMWRLNWIHPFTDGNGRTARTLSYLILCVRLGNNLPGAPTIPQQIEQNRTPYFKALEAADRAERENREYDFSEMEEMLKGMLARQLMSIIEQADGAAMTG